MQTSLARRVYDHRIQEAICASGDRGLFPELQIPQSTIRNWIHRGIPDVVTCETVDFDRAELVAEVEALRQRTALLGAVVGLLMAMLRASNVRFEYERLQGGGAKQSLLRAIERAGKVLPLDASLRIVKLSPSRYHSWCRTEAGCNLDDQASCPRIVPTKLTRREVEVVQEMVENTDHRHMSIRALALHAQRIGRVFASASTWYRLVRSGG
jgi:hypothetical protein